MSSCPAAQRAQPGQACPLPMVCYNHLQLFLWQTQCLGGAVHLAPGTQADAPIDAPTSPAPSLPAGYMTSSRALLCLACDNVPSHLSSSVAVALHYCCSPCGVNMQVLGTPSAGSPLALQGACTLTCKVLLQESGTCGYPATASTGQHMRQVDSGRGAEYNCITAAPTTQHWAATSYR